jgi:hypothetical protein
MSVPVFITYRDRRTFLDKTLASLVVRGFDDITVIDNDSLQPLVSNETYKVVRSDNSHRQLAPWLLNLIPDDSYYIVMDCDIELDCPTDVESVLIGLGIRVDDLLFPPPDHYAYSYLMEYSVERGTRYKRVPELSSEDVKLTRALKMLAAPIINAPIDTHFAMHRPGSGWSGITGARTTSPYLCRHLPWYEAEYTPDERLYYERAGKAWTMGHSAESLLATTVAVPFTQLHQETVVALSAEQVRYAPMTHENSYFELFSDLWNAGKSFIIVEHDIVVNETTIDELRICEHDWCAMPFPYRGEERAYSLACSRFSAGLIRKIPELPEIVGEMWDDTHPMRHWCRLDAWIWQVLTTLGEKRHEHSRSEPVGHIGPQYPKHGCLPIPSRQDI